MKSLIIGTLILFFMLFFYDQGLAENRVWLEAVEDIVPPPSFLVTYCPCESYFYVMFSNDTQLEWATVPLKWYPFGYMDSSCNTISSVFSGSRIQNVPNKSIQVDNVNHKVLISFQCGPDTTIPPGSGILCLLSLNGLSQHFDEWLHVDTTRFPPGIPIAYGPPSGPGFSPEFADTSWYLRGPVNMIPDIWGGGNWTVMRGATVEFQVGYYWNWDVYYFGIANFSPPGVNPPMFTWIPYQGYGIGIFTWTTDPSESTTTYQVSFEVEDHYCRFTEGARTEIKVVACGDANADFQINAADVVYLTNYLFIDGPAPPIFSLGDVNLDGKINATDVVYLINYLFIGGPAPCET